MEPSFADLKAAIATSGALPDETRRAWSGAVTAIAKAFDQPLETIPARYTAVRARMAALHHVPLNCSAKTLANHRSNAKAALLWFAKDKGLPQHGVAFSPAWDRLRLQLTDPSTRYRVTPLMRFCSGTQIEPNSVNEEVIDRYFEHRVRTTSRAADAASRRILARLWNGCIGKIEGWPKLRLNEPPAKSKDEGPVWEEFPEGLRTDVERELQRLAQIHRNKDGQRSRACKASTLTMRKREIIAAARMAVRMGVPIENLTSLRAMIHPDVAEKILDGYWPKDIDAPNVYAINLSCRFVGLAHVCGLDGEAITRLGDLRFALEQYRDVGMTEKNLELIRLVLTEGVWSRVVNLPRQLLRKARQLRETAPIRAAVLAQLAVAVAILTVAPIRLANLASIQLGENMHKPGGPDSNFWLTFRKYDVKNRTPLQFKLDDTVTAIINEYVHDFRPVLMRGSNADWLFPGEKGHHKEKISFSSQIVDCVEKSTGLRITVHQFRHAAGALILKHRPGEYELVRRLLGHKNIDTHQEFLPEFGNYAGKRNLHQHRSSACRTAIRGNLMQTHTQSVNSAGAVRLRRQVARARSLSIPEWPKQDRVGWVDACRPAERLKRGGAGCNLAPVSRKDFANRYGLYLDYLLRHGLFNANEGAATLVIPDKVAGFTAELKARVRSVTVWNSIYKLRRAAELIAPNHDFRWLSEIEKDLALEMVPRSKNDRLVLTERLVEAGLILIKEAEMFGKTKFVRAAGVRNGLIIILLALHPIRIKNFTALTIDDSFVNINGRWWLRIPAGETKSKSVDQRQVPEFVTALVDRYVREYRKVLTRDGTEQKALWISSTTSRQMTVKNLGTLISKLTRETLGVDVSPHLFRTAGASTAAIYAPKRPHLSSGLLGHRDKRITEDHYNQATSLDAGIAYTAITERYRGRGPQLRSACCDHIR